MLSSPSERTLLLRVRSLTDVSRCNWQQDWPYLRIAEVRFLHASAIRISCRLRVLSARCPGPARKAEGDVQEQGGRLPQMPWHGPEILSRG